jgi:L-seryl-tRNA(Ser) seleniumtransferase
MTRDPRREIPAVDQWLGSARGRELCEEFSRPEVLEVVRARLNAIRRGATNGGGLPNFEGTEFQSLLRADLLERRTDSLQPAINATGIVIHTNLGRAPLPREAVAAIDAVAKGYSTLEFDAESGQRGSRYEHVEPLLMQLTGAKAALVVNNCAAALTLALRYYARDREVVVSRGELIEIGGSFRMPDVIAESGAKMIEVGTTNRTSLDDYADAVGDDTRMLLVSHTSNYRIVGFTSKPSLRELATLAHENGCLAVHDLGSGCLVGLAKAGLPSEPTVADSLAAGIDLVTFSGDKLLGGPQCGVIAGRKDLIDPMRSTPLLRAMRIDKLSLAALAATLRLYLPPHDPFRKVPVLRMMTEPIDNVGRRSRRLIAHLKSAGIAGCSIVDGVSFAGGGSLPTNEIPTKLIRLEHQTYAPGQIAERLRQGRPAVIGRISDGAFVIDMRTVRPHETKDLTDAIVAALVEER